MRYTVLFVAFAVLLLSCLPKQEAQNGQVPTNGKTAQVPSQVIELTFVLTDLGLEDGQHVRQADSVFNELDSSVIKYTAIGELPLPLTTEAGISDVGLPVEGSTSPGEMTMVAAEQLLDEAGKSDWLVLSTPLLLDAVLERVAAGSISTGLVLLLDDYGLTETPVDPAVPVYTIAYDIQPAAFLLGVAAAKSSNNGMFIVMASEDDPHAQEFLDAVWTGAKYTTNGAVVADTVLPMDDNGLITVEVFLQLQRQLRQRMGPYFDANHYILAVGRTTPTLLYACTSEPFKGYVAGGYGDFRQVRPARIVGCAEKRPGAALRYIFSQIGDGTLVDLADESGMIRVGLDESALGFTDLDMYSRVNPDGDDIAEAIENVWAEIQVGELDVPKLIEDFKSKEQNVSSDQ